MSNRPSTPPLTIGDALPPIDMPGPDGRLVYLSHQAVRGHTIVLWFAGAAPDHDQVKTLAALQTQFSELEAKTYAVVTGKPRPSPVDPLACIFDPDGRAGNGVLTGATGIAVIDPAWHLHAVLAGNDFAGALEHCRALFQRSEPRTVSLQAPVLLIGGVFEPVLCRRLVAYWGSGEKIHDQIAAQDPSDAAAQALKKRADVHVTDNKLVQRMEECLRRRVVPEVFKAFNIAVNHFEYMRIGCYDASNRGEFRRHRDNTVGNTRHRQFALSINLNAGEYEGGQVRFPEYGRQLYAPATGGALVFSCSLLHEALPVTQGKRFGVFTFVHDKEHEVMRQHLMREAQQPGMQIRTPVGPHLQR